jgi:hypothetical protein
MNLQEIAALNLRPIAQENLLAVCRIFLKVNPNEVTGCWEYQGRLNWCGYGAFILHKLYGVHRVAYTFLKGDIPKDMAIDHLCCVRHCVNPEHLEAVTQCENTRRVFTRSNGRRSLTHCKYGHEKTEENTRTYKMESEDVGYVKSKRQSALPL